MAENGNGLRMLTIWSTAREPVERSFAVPSAACRAGVLAACHQGPVLRAVLPEPHAETRWRCREVGLQRLGRDPIVAVGLQRVGPDGTFVAAGEDVDQLVLDQAVVVSGRSGQAKPISSSSRRPAASIADSSGRGWLQQVLVHKPPEWYLATCRFCSSRRPA